ncbi:ALQxL family class IV lanthipeptide [Streptomyces sparsogenes]
MELDPDALQLLPAPDPEGAVPTTGTCMGITCDTGATCGITCPMTN